MEVISEREYCNIKFYSYRIKDHEYIAEQIFANKKPRSPIMSNIKHKVQNVIKENSTLIKHPSYIQYEGLELINDQYFILRKGSQIYKPATYYLEEGNLSIEDTGKMIEDFLEIAKEAELKGLDWQHITLDSFWLDDTKNLKFIDPDIIQEINKYRKVSGIKNVETYQPTEVFKNYSWDQQGRIYSAGVCFYYLLTGESPFKEENKSDLVHDILNLSVIEPIYINTSISQALNNLLMKSLYRERENRLKTWDDFLEEFRKVKANGLSANNVEEEENKKKASRILKKSDRKRKAKLFWRDRWKTIAIGIVIIAGILMINSMGGREDIITEETTAIDVVSYFYQAIDQKDSELLKETNTVELGRLERMVAESYVIEAMQSAYDYELNTQAREGLFGVNDLYIEDISTENKKIYKANYTFYYKLNPQPDQVQESEIIRHDVDMEDMLFLKKINDIWRIVNLEGSIEYLINADFDGLIESN
ncbi:MAG: protein kinase domain-containing protein [Halanaerobiales bacterium]